MSQKFLSTLLAGPPARGEAGPALVAHGLPGGPVLFGLVRRQTGFAAVAPTTHITAVTERILGTGHQHGQLNSGFESDNHRC